jgi:hypothetical protein
MPSSSPSPGHLNSNSQGDGGLQMTAQELGTFARFGSNAIVCVIENNGYLVERYLSPIAHSCESGPLLVWGGVVLGGLRGERVGIGAAGVSTPASTCSETTGLQSRATQ